MGQGALVGSNHSEVSGVKFIFWQSGDSLLCDWVLFDDQVVKPWKLVFMNAEMR